MSSYFNHPKPLIVSYRVWAEGYDAVETTHLRDEFWTVARWYCSQHLQPGQDYDFGETITICVECGGVALRFNARMAQEILYDIEEIRNSP